MLNRKGRKTFNYFDRYKKDKNYLILLQEEKELLALALQVAKERQRKGLTQAQLAKKAKMPQSQLARIESGNNNVTVATLSKIANALGKKLQIC